MIELEQEIQSLKRKMDVAYCAGLVDGEGCFFIHHGIATAKDKKYPDKLRHYHQCNIHLIVGMADKEPLDFLSRTFGGDVNPFKRQGKLHFRWVLCSDKAALVTLELLPLLQGKREQAGLFLIFHQIWADGKYKHNRDYTLLDAIEAEIKLVRKVPLLEEDLPATTEREDLLSEVEEEGCDSLNSSGNEPGEVAEMTTRLN